jgi:proteasome lid subunit RPN8/RPN11
MDLQSRHIAMLFALTADASDEVCGVLIGRRTPAVTLDTIIVGRNVHRVPRRHFMLDAQTLLQADTQARAAEREIVGFFHSHPTSSALPSSHDRRDAWPNHIYLIVAVHPDMPQYLSAWVCDASGQLRPEPILPAQR